MRSGNFFIIKRYFIKKFIYLEKFDFILLEYAILTFLSFFCVLYTISTFKTLYIYIYRIMIYMFHEKLLSLNLHEYFRHYMYFENVTTQGT